MQPASPSRFVVRLDSTNDKQGRQLLADASSPNVHAESTMDGAARRVVPGD